MDSIILKNIKLYGYHGVLSKERESGQYFKIDIELFLDLKKAGESDNLDDTVDYSKVYDIVKRINENNKFRLVERFAHVISQEIMSTFKEIQEISVVIKKPSAPIKGKFKWVGIEIKRSRDEA
ncbi:dihydroneopterin aldolase [Herbivorax sp. ANBcel31]|uniref:dihydroneopterin aldolase n=1 Tax=Herbivorax sp. ANBcel31 TaxID=3069754 RepID=UPI0027B00D1A|nr:dihydroneopterin aldolase [Herbivorax sp. ANBcel31]MDQ2086380.1 dihydroneopterin aldolase [Herbivorax sp. ANBcel31]